MHLLAERHILAGLKEGGWLQGEVEDMLEQRIAALFMPHGILLLQPSHLSPTVGLLLHACISVACLSPTVGLYMHACTSVVVSVAT